MPYNQCQFLTEYKSGINIGKEKQCLERGYEHFCLTQLGAPLIIYVCDEHLFFIKVNHD